MGERAKDRERETIANFLPSVSWAEAAGRPNLWFVLNVALRLIREEEEASQLTFRRGGFCRTGDLAARILIRSQHGHGSFRNPLL